MNFTIIDKKLIVSHGETEITYRDILNATANYDIDEDIDEIVLPDTIKTIHEDAFFDFYKIKRINIPANVQYIGAQAFWGLDNLEELTLPITVQFVGKHAFCNCGELTLTVLGSSGDIPSGWDAAFAANIKEVRFQENAC